ncbi:MAG: nuclear transport factor 2 family protein [Caldilineaceae bacterium]|nr:nuclear transport factor 2 family protein [Caldilineaceae bacterium]
MTKVIFGEDCGNAPKRLQLRDFNIAYAKNDIEHILQNITDDVRWEIAGVKLVEGKDQVAEVMEQMKDTKTTELNIKNIITHGNVGAVDGITKLADGSSYAFCGVYRFSSHAKHAKIKEITLYRIAL